MEVEKRGVKGGFFQLFDWNCKSRKKLFSGKSELPESSNQGKENYHGSVIARHQQGLEKGFPSNGRGQNDYHCDSEYGTKAPGVVARLMGLDSLPTSKVNEPCFVEPHSFRDSGYLMSATAFQGEHDIVIFESLRNMDGFSRNPLDPRVQKMQSRHLERFQTEVLPSKPAKPISVTHHRLLSPIKSPGFIPPKNAAYIIEAAAKIIEQNPRCATKGNFPSSLRSSSFPFRVRDIKEMEASQRTFRLADASLNSQDQTCMNLKKHISARAKSRSEDNYLYRASEESKRAGYHRLKSKEKPVSLAVQPKATTQKLDGLTRMGNNRSYEKQKEHNDVRTSCVSRDIPNSAKKLEKKSLSRKHSEVLKLNNQKQNHAFDEKEENCGPSCSHPKERKESNLSTNHIHGRMNRTVNKIVVNNVMTSRKTNFVAADPGKELSSLRTKTTSKRKMPIEGNTRFGGSVAENTVMMQDEKSVKCNVEFQGDFRWDGFDKKNNISDVISFTFTSPIKKSGSGSSSCCTVLEAISLSFPNCDPYVHESDFRSYAATSSGSNVIGGDSLSVLLEQKLKELTSRVEMFQKDLSEADSFSTYTNSYENMSPTINLLNSLPVDDDTFRSKREIQYNSDYLSAYKHALKAGKEQKGLAIIGRDGDDNYIDLQGLISFSNQPSLLRATCETSTCSNNEGPLPCLSLESYDGTKSHIAEGDASSSLISQTVNSSSYMMVGSADSSNWELQYIGDILSSAELLLEEFALGLAYKVIAPDLFDRLENQKRDSCKHEPKKVVFDCVCECLEVRCGRLLAGSCKFWVKQMTMLQRKRLLADYLYREISSWKNVEELMVDELVDKDMSSKSGKWIGFEIEAFEQGIEMEETILTSLVDELIDDFFLSCPFL